MSGRSSANIYLRGTVIRKGANGSANATPRLGTPVVQSTSTTIFSGGVKDPSGRTSEYSSEDDVCPVCKSDRYLNPKLRLLVSACYHKMCESCIDRLFTLGPAPCPICGKILRKLAFTPQTFEDLGVEKEVAVRRRIGKEFNKRREDFPDLRSYNDYLEEVEDITFNLINGIDVQETEARILQYRAANAAIIELNIQREHQYAEQLKAQEGAERLEREQRALELRRAEEEEREALEKAKQEIIDKLETSDKDATKLVARSRAEALRRASARTQSAAQALQNTSSRLLRTRAAASAVVPDPPHVPLQDDWYAYEDMFVLRDKYDDPMSEAVRKDREGIMRAGGYMMEEAWTRALRSAVAGLEIAPLDGLHPTGAVPQSLSADGDVVMTFA